MSIETLGTDPEFIARVREAAGGCKSRADALRDALSVAGVRTEWHEAETVANALRHRYDTILETSLWLTVREWRDPDRLATCRRHMRLDLVLEADKQGLALVDEPVEWRYASPEADSFRRPTEEDARGRTPLTAEQVASLPDGYVILLKLVGHVQRLDA